MHEQHAAQRVLVQPAARAHELLEARERRREELGLAKEAFGAAVDLHARLEAVGHQAVEIGHRAVTPPQLVVERQHLDDQSRPETKWCGCAAVAGRRRGAGEEHFPLERGEHGRRRSEPCVQPEIELVASE